MAYGLWRVIRMFQLYAISDQPYAFRSSNSGPERSCYVNFVGCRYGCSFTGGIRLFNEGRFFESHETLEQFYQETEDANKPFLED